MYTAVYIFVVMLHNIIVQKIKIEETNLIWLQIYSSQWFCLFLINLLISKIFLDYLCTWVFACLSVCLVPGSLGGQKSALDSLKLYCEWLWDRMWILGTELRYSERATRALSLWATSPAMRLTLFGIWVCTCVWIWVCAHVSTCPQRPEEWIRFLELEFQVLWSSWHGSWEPHPAPLQETWVL